MSCTQLELRRLQHGLRGRKVVSAGRSVGSCVLINFSKSRSERSSGGSKPGLMVELAEWKLRHGGTIVASSCSWKRVIGSVVPKLAGARIAGANIGKRGHRACFRERLCADGFDIEAE